MEVTQLERLRDTVCAAITSDLNQSDFNDLLNAIEQIPIRDGLLRNLYDNPELRTKAAQNLGWMLEQDCGSAKSTIATVLAGCYWLDGNFEATRKALDLALTADSTYSLARLLDVALVHGVPPSVWADSLAAVSPEQCLTGAA